MNGGSTNSNGKDDWKGVAGLSLASMGVVYGDIGTSPLYGDGMITPAISVLSAIEGLEVATTAFEPYVIPITIAVLAGLFAVQRLGTAGIGRLFGPLMLLWFLVLSVSGIAAIVGRPSVLAAFDPRHAVAFFGENGLAGLTILGIAFLVVTGGEALYADLGHFGKRPVRIGWYGVVLPSLLLNYFGQGALYLARPGEVTNPFFQMTPGWALYPMVALSTMATVIASQAIISGVFSLTYQAVQLGYLPRINIRHTSSEQRGQIYIPLLNWVLLAAVAGLVLGFRRSGALAGAYGVAIAATMVITSLLYGLAMRKIFQWPLAVVISLTAAFLLIDLPFFVANMGKFLDGGWFPLLVAALVYLLMATWTKGYGIERRKARNFIVPVREFLAEIGGGGAYRRVPGQAVYLASNARGTPQVLRRNLRHNRALHNKTILFTVVFVKAPRVADDHLNMERLRDDIVRIVSYRGYMQRPDVPRDVAEADRRHDLGLDLERLTYFVGEKVMAYT